LTTSDVDVASVDIPETLAMKDIGVLWKSKMEVARILYVTAVTNTTFESGGTRTITTQF
jgi:hypothetical protein